MKKRPYGKYTPEQESGSSEETESAARRESLRDLARQGIYHGSGSRHTDSCRYRKEDGRK
ncbi:MAG: hypothetical protein K1W10_00300 [Lachnospiraceae bacterium]|uniref:hypothetical protein n=1 Tax=Sporofaciens sp. JLR.KK001 TaxID=3112621 RepID=UPI002FF33E94